MSIRSLFFSPACPLFLSLVLGAAPAAASPASAVDPALALALETLWEGQSPATSVVSRQFSERVQGDTLTQEPDVRDGIRVVTSGPGTARVHYQRWHFDAVDTPWGGFPRLDTARAELTRIDIPRRRYQVLSAPGTELFGIGDWARFGFLHVLDVTRRNQPVHYPLVAEAGLGTRVLGLLPGSSTLNYARLVPTRWVAGQPPRAYEVTLYALEPRGPRKVIRDGKPLTYRLSRNGASWDLEATSLTPVTDERDAHERPFTSRPTALVGAPAVAVSE